MREVIDIRRAGDPRDVIHRAVQYLADDRLVALPTETTYALAASAIGHRSVERLRSLFDHNDAARHALAVKGLPEAMDFVPRMSPLGQRLARHCWPGPVTLQVPLSEGEGLVESLPEGTRATVVRRHELRLRSPAHEVASEVLRLVPAPLVLCDENLPEFGPFTSAECISDQFGDDLTLVIDSGASAYAKPSSVVQVSGDEWVVIEPGVVGDATLERLASEVYLFVCTGNTCRSPMAEALFRNLLAERLKCSPDELVQRGFLAASAGLAATFGAPAAQFGVDVLKERHIDLVDHASQPLTNRLLDQSDRVYTMTRGHRDAILADRPDLADRVHMLSPEEVDVSDPIGGSIDDYRQCRDEIERHVRALLEQIQVK